MWQLICKYARVSAVSCECARALKGSEGSVIHCANLKCDSVDGVVCVCAPCGKGLLINTGEMRDTHMGSYVRVPCTTRCVESSFCVIRA